MLNSFTFEGNLGDNATTTEFSNSTVTKFDMCSTNKWTDKENEVKEESVWMRCELWNAKKYQVEQLTKGARVIVLDATLKDATYTNKDGVKVKDYVLRVNNYRIIATNKKEE